MSKNKSKKFLLTGASAALVMSAIVPVAFAEESVEAKDLTELEISKKEQAEITSDVEKNNEGDSIQNTETETNTEGETSKGTQEDIELSEKIKDVIDSLILETYFINENAFEFILTGDEEDLEALENVIIKEDGVFVTVENQEVKISDIEERFTENLENKRALRLAGQKAASVMHYVEGSELVLTTSNYEDIIISSKVSEPFTDVNTKDWFQKDVEEIYNYGFTTGTTATTFSPNAKITRGQFAGMIARALELTGEKSTGTKEFKLTDLKGKWYAEEVQALVKLGIIGGYENGKFGGEDNLTRQQAMAILGRTLEHLNVNAKSENEINVDDSNKISEYAKEYVNYFAENDILVSGDNVSFNPQSDLTRAQMAKVLVRALKLTDKY